MSEFLQPVIDVIPDQTLPDPDTISYYVLEKDRKIYLDFDVDRCVLTIQRMILRWNMEDRGKPVEDRKPIHLYVMSYGGDLDCMWMLVDAIESSVTPVYTVNIGVAGSAASLIFLAGHKRFMTKRGRIIIHEGSAHLAGDAVKVMDASDSYRKQLKQMKDYILSRTSITPQQLNKKRSNDWELDSAYCIEHGVCHAIVGSVEEII